MRTRRLLERLDGRLERLDVHMERLDAHMTVGNELMGEVRDELRLSRESRDRIVADLRQLANDVQTRFEHLARRYERHIADNTTALQGLRDDNKDILHALNAQSRGIFDLLRRVPPAAGESDAPA